MLVAAHPVAAPRSGTVPRDAGRRGEVPHEGAIPTAGRADLRYSAASASAIVRWPPQRQRRPGIPALRKKPPPRSRRRTPNTQLSLRGSFLPALAAGQGSRRDRGLSAVAGGGGGGGRANRLGQAAACRPASGPGLAPTRRPGRAFASGSTPPAPGARAVRTAGAGRGFGGTEGGRVCRATVGDWAHAGTFPGGLVVVRSSVNTRRAQGI